MRNILTIAGFLLASNLLCREEIVQKSVTGQSISYREICRDAALDDLIFQKFRSMKPYFDALECGQGGEFADYILKYATAKTRLLIPEFRKLDLYGDPVRNEIPKFGQFSGATLRYVLFGDLMCRLFDLPQDCTVVEIGAGFGGQAYVLSHLVPFSNYYVYDLPEAEMLIDKMMSTLDVQNVTCLEATSELPVESVDLLISNYSLSECDLETQLDYFHRVVIKAKRGYMIFNDTNPLVHLTLSDFIDLLQFHGISPKIHPEPVFTYTGNHLITWDQTK